MQTDFPQKRSLVTSRRVPLAHRDYPRRIAPAFSYHHDFRKPLARHGVYQMTVVLLDHHYAGADQARDIEN